MISITSHGGLWIDIIVVHILLCTSYSRATQTVVLNSTLNARRVSYPDQEVVFTCETRNADTLEWTSREYIGPGNDVLQLVFIEGAGHEKSNPRNPSTIAKIVSVDDVSGVVVIVSELRVVASSRIPHASVSCRGTGSVSSETITFSTTDSPAQSVNCTLRRNLYACPGDTLYITCAAKDTHSLSWISEDYIGMAQLNISSHYHRRDLNYSDSRVVAMLANMSTVNETLLLTSILIITVLPSIMDHMHTITCVNVDIGTRSSILFEMAGDCSYTTSMVESMGSDLGLEMQAISTVQQSNNGLFFTSTAVKPMRKNWDRVVAVLLFVTIWL